MNRTRHLAAIGLWLLGPSCLMALLAGCSGTVAAKGDGGPDAADGGVDAGADPGADPGGDPGADASGDPGGDAGGDASGDAGPDGGDGDGGAVDPGPAAGLIPDFPLWQPPADAVHIDPEQGSDAAGDGSRANPYASLAPVAWSEGLVVVLRRGTTLEADAIGLGADGLTLASYGQGPRPVLRCTAVAQPGANRHAIRLDGPSGVTVRDLVIDAPEATSCLRAGGADGLALINCALHGAGWGLRAFSLSGLEVYNTEVYDIDDDGMFIQGVTDIEIHHCHVHHVNRNWTPPYTPQSEAGGDAIQLSNCDRWNVHHNLLDRSDSGNKFCFIANNPAQSQGRFEHNRLYGPQTGGDGGASIYFGDGQGLLVRYNQVGPPSPGPLYSHAAGLEIAGNVFVGLSGGLYASHSARVVNNVFYDMPAAVSGGAIEARNNVFASGAAAAQPFGATASLAHSHNLYTQGPAPDGSLVGQPAFADPAGGDFHLGPGSDCIDQGTDVGLARDADGTPIPQGAAPDIGAYEHRP